MSAPCTGQRSLRPGLVMPAIFIQASSASPANLDTGGPKPKRHAINHVARNVSGSLLCNQTIAARVPVAQQAHTFISPRRCCSHHPFFSHTRLFFSSFFFESPFFCSNLNSNSAAFPRRHQRHRSKHDDIFHSRLVARLPSIFFSETPYSLLLLRSSLLSAS